MYWLASEVLSLTSHCDAARGPTMNEPKRNQPAARNSQEPDPGLATADLVPEKPEAGPAGTIDYSAPGVADTASGAKAETVPPAPSTGRLTPPATVDLVPAGKQDAATGTVDYGPAPETGTADFAPTPAGTVDFLDRPPGTVDFVEKPTGTVDYVEKPGAAGTADAVGKAETKASRSDESDGGRDVSGFSVGGYDLLSTLGEGAMGVVYKARQRGLKRLVALKMISGAHANERQRTRFRGEAEAAATLQHPNIVQIYEIGDHDGRPYISLEFVTGGSLEKKIDDTPQAPRYAAEMVRTLALAMDHAHHHKIVHRDLKPANVLLTPDGTPKIADFGLAKQLDDDSVNTQTGTILGTPSYMAPEQAEGKTKEIGPPADIYALGAVLYDLLTGRPPFRGVSLWDTVSQVKTKEVVPPRQLQPSIPADLETICLKCLQKEALKRYATAGELAEDLQRFLDGKPIKARPVSAPERLLRWCRRNPVPAGLIALAALFVIGWLATATVLWQRAEDNAKLARDNAEDAWEKKQLADINAEDAKQKKILADNYAEEAKQKKKLADDKAAEAQRNFENSNILLLNSFSNIQGMVGKLYTQLQPKPGQPQRPEAAALQKELVAQARAALTHIAKDFSKAGISDMDVVVVHDGMGNLFLKLGESEEARQQYQQAVALLQKYAQQRPNDVKVNGNLAFMLEKVGNVTLAAGGDAATAAACFGEAFQRNELVWKNLPKKATTDAEKKKALETIKYRQKYFAKFAESAGLMWDPAGSRKWLEAALAGWQAQCSANPNDKDSQSCLAQTHSLLGDACSWQGDWKACQKHHQAAIDIMAQLTEQYPTDHSFPADLAFVYTAYGDAYLRKGESDKALEFYGKGLPKAEGALVKEPNSHWVNIVLAHVYQRQGTLLACQGKKDAATMPLAESLKRWQKLTQLDKKNLSYQAGLCVALARTGQYAAAQNKADMLLKQAPKHPEVLLGAARCLALCIPSNPDEAPALTDKAVKQLAKAVQQGYRNVAALTLDPDWQPLASDPGFKQVLAAAKQPAAGK
jgi:serine/threonine-protein kinase